MPKAKSEDTATRDARREKRERERTLKLPLAPEHAAAVAGMPGAIRADFGISEQIAEEACLILERKAARRRRDLR
jgi:hypothetical protein